MLRLRWGALAAVAAAACSVDTVAISPIPGDAGAVDTALPDAPSDTSVAPDDSRVPLPDSAAVDGAVDAAVDSGPPSACPPVDRDTVFLFTFDGEALDDATGRHDGRSPAPPSFEDGRCGSGLHFDRDDPVWMEIPDSADFDLDEGSIDFWLRLAAPLGAQYGLVTRDSFGYGAGHMSIVVTSEGRIVARLQTPAREVWHCTEEGVAVGGFRRVLFQFGEAGSALWVDGVRATSTANVTLVFGGFAFDIDCGGSILSGIAGAANPFFVGASGARRSSPADPAEDPVRGGTIDHLRLSRVRRAP